MPPLISVCIPTYNSQSCVSQAIDSVLGQSYQNFQIVIADNASSDGVVELCRQYQSRDDRIVVHSFDVNIGVYGNFSRLIKLSDGAYIKILGSDDLLEPRCLEVMVERFEQSTGVTLVGCAQKDISDEGLLVRTVSAYEQSGVISGRQAARDILLKMSNNIGAPTSVMMRRLDCLEGFDRRYFFFADMDMWCRLLQKGDFCFISEPLTTLKLHNTTGTDVNFKTLLFLADILRLRDQYRAFMGEEGISSCEWDKIVDERIMSYVDYVMLEQKLTADMVRQAAKRLKNIVGTDASESLIESLAILVYCGFRRAHELNIDARWARGQVSNLERVIDDMINTMTWKLAAPLRKLRSYIKERRA